MDSYAVFFQHREFSRPGVEETARAATMSDKTAYGESQFSWMSQFNCFSGLTAREGDRVSCGSRHVTVPPG
jgi:hypothetical protein